MPHSKSDKLVSPDIKFTKWSTRSRVYWSLSFTISAILIFVFCYHSYYPKLYLFTSGNISIVFMSFIVMWSLLYSGFTIAANISSRIQEIVWEKNIATQDVQNLQENIQNDFFTKLVQINFKYIDKYYSQTQLQANKSFSVCLFVGAVAFMIIIVGIILLYVKKIESGYLAAASGVTSEFIAAIFFYLYNKTISKMAEYHQKLVLTQNISLALKITEQMTGEEKTNAQVLLITQLTTDINMHLAVRSE